MLENKVDLGDLNLDELRTRVGFCLLKPDAVAWGIAEYLIAYLSEIMLINCEADLGIVTLVQLNDLTDILTIYPSLDEPTHQAMTKYMSSGPSVLVTFHSRNKLSEIDLWKFLTKIKGKTMWNWTPEQLEAQVGIQGFIRGLVPLPGTEMIFDSIISKVKEKQRLTDEEYFYYLQNLIHTPDTAQEVAGLLSFLDKEEIKLTTAEN